MIKKSLALFLTVVLVFTTTAFGFTASAVGTEESYDTFDEFTLSDLGLNPGNFENSLSGGSHSYTGNSTSHSVVVKFQWEPNLDTTDDQGWFIALDFDYNFRAGVWFRGKDIRFCYNSDKTAPYQKLSPINSGKHSVEFGRKLVISGSNTGKYYVYLMVDNEILADGYTDEFTSADYNSGNGMQNAIYLSGSLFSEQRFADSQTTANTETYDTFDELTLSDLGLNPGIFENSLSTGGHSYTGNSTSHSVAVKFQWEPHLADNDDKGWLIVLDFDYNYRAGVWFRGKDIRFCYNSEKTDPYQKLSSITSGKHDVEFGRKLVVSGPNKDKYYVYLMVDNEILADGYTDEYSAAGYNSGNGMQNKIYLNGDLFGDQRFADTQISANVETYDTFDELTLSDLGLKPGNFENSLSGGGNSYTGNSTSHSVVVKFQWEPNLDETDDKGWFIAFDFDYNYRAGVWFRGKDIRFCYNSDKTDPYQKLSSITSGRHSVEFGRKLVITGPNKDKYYVYLMVDDEILADGYTDEYSASDYNSGNGMQNRIYFNGNLLSDQRFANIQTSNTETYEPYDEIDYTDLMDSSGNPLKENTNYSGANIFTYNRTSPTGSAILKYRWTVGTVSKFQLSFDHAYESNGTTKSMGYMFGVQVSAPSNEYPNGELYLRPSYGKRSNLNNPFEVENVYDIEFARLKVATGPNKGKYYVYIKIDGVIISESYTEANIVDSNNRYNTKPGVDGNTIVTISNKIYLAFWGSTNNKLSQTWDNGKGYYVNYYANGKLVEKVPFTLDDPTVEGREPAVPTIPNASGVWESHPTTNLDKEFNVYAVYNVTAPTEAGTAITLNKFGGATVDLKTDIINDYLALTPEQQSDYARNYSTSLNGYQDHQNISFRWTASGSDSSYTAYFADNPNFDNAFIVSTTNTELINEVGIFVPGKTYYWFVAGNDSGKCSAVDTFTTDNEALRYITAGGVINMRDEGGYITDSGRKIKYGLVYRGASLDEETSYINDIAYHVFNYLGMKSEIELRGSYTHTKTGWDNANSNVYHINGVYYSEILSIDDQVKAQYKATFEAMADRSNYPFYFHCSAGADRTGTFAYLLNGLLGVSIEQLREDYELTSFSKIGRRSADDWTNGNSFDRMHSELMAQYGDGSGNVSAAIENFLTQYIGVDKSTLNSIKEIMLEINPFDLNGDTDVDANDVTALREAILFDSTDLKFDVNTDGKIDVRDLVRMKKYLAGLISVA